MCVYQYPYPNALAKTLKSQKCQQKNKIKIPKSQDSKVQSKKKS